LVFLSLIPVFFLAPLAGVLIDRWDRRRLLIITQVLSAIQAIILFALVVTNIIEVWHVVILGIFLGLVNAFDMPARQVFVVDIIEKKEDLGNAIALNSAMVNIARLFGPSLAGIILAWKGEGLCFFINAISYLAAILALVLMDVAPIPEENRSKKLDPLVELKEGF